MSRAHMNIDVIEPELLRAIRGSWSQNQLSRKLGFPFNQAYRWESGNTRISWSDFVRMTRARKCNLEFPLRERLGYFGKLDNGQALVTHLIGNLSSVEAAKKTGLSAYVIRSLKTGRTRASLGAVLTLIRDLQNYLPEFVALLTDIRQVSSLMAEVELRDRQRKFFFDHPIANVAMHFLNLSENRSKSAYSNGYLARKLGIPQDEEKYLLEKMLDSGVVKKVNGHYEPMCLDLETSGNFQDALRVRKFWQERILNVLDRIQSRPEFTLFALASYEVSVDGYQRIRQAHYEFLTKMYEILSTDKDPKERVIIQAFQMLDIEETSGIIQSGNG